MLRAIYPDIRIQRLLADWYAWQGTDAQENQVSGKRAWLLVEWILAASWSGAISVRRTGDNQIIFSQHDTDVCAIMADSSLDFFYLSKDVAVAVAEYWHHLRGLLSFINSCPQGHVFDACHAWHGPLQEQLTRIHIVTTVLPTPSELNGEHEPITYRDRIKELTGQVIAEYTEFARRTEIVNDGSLGSDQERFQQIATNEQSFDDWVATASRLFIRRLPFLPSDVHRKDVVDRDLLFDYLRLREDSMLGRVSPRYRAIREFEERVFHECRETDAFQFERIQIGVLNSLLSYFGATTERRRRIGEQHVELWRAELQPNPWHGRISDGLRDEVNALESIHARLRSKGDRRKFFIEGSGTDLCTHREMLVSADSQMNSDRVWSHLFSTALMISRSIREALEPSLCPRDPPADHINPSDWRRRRIWNDLMKVCGPHVRERLQTLDRMRNREAHGKTPEQRHEWVRIQRTVRDMLGREWDTRQDAETKQHDADDDLELTGYEGIVVKRELIRAVNTWLSEIAKREPWNSAG